VAVTGSTASCTGADNTFLNNGTAGVTVTTTADDSSITCVTPTTTAGTVTVNVYGFTSGARNTTATSKLTITVVAALSGTVYSYSTATMNNVAATANINTYTNAATGAVTRYAKASAGNTVELFRVDIEQFDAADAGLTDASTKAVTATLSGLELLLSLLKM